jgi:hypothetical protein
MPELSDSTTEGPKINVLYVAPGHEVISPDQVEMSKLETVAIGAGTQLARLSSSMLVKYGTHASLIEAKTIRFVAEHTSIPVPKLYAAYAYGPLDRDIDDAGSLYDTYIFMEFIEGDTLEKSWNSYDSTAKLQIAADLKEYIEQLRSLLSTNYIGSVDRGPVTDVILEWSTSDKGQSTRLCFTSCFGALQFKCLLSFS